MQISWQALFYRPRSAHFVVGAAQYFVDLEMQFLWQAQYFVDMKAQIGAGAALCEDRNRNKQIAKEKKRKKERQRRNR